MRVAWLVVVVFVALAPMVTALSAGESTENWQALPPESDIYDWVQLTSGELLKGEIIAMYEEDLEFDSDKLNLLNLKWKDVKQLWSARTMEIAFENGEVARGRVFIDETTIRFVDQDDRQVMRSDILSMIAGAPREIDHWAIKASLSANLRSGNSEQIEITGRGILKRRSTTFDIEIIGWLDFEFDWRANIVNEESGSYPHHLVSGLEFELTKLLDLDITMIWDRIKNPQADSEGVVPLKDDYRLVTSLALEF